MNSELIMNSDVLDILFEKRNKLYGAYTLRKFYNNRLMKAVGVTLSVAVILSAFTFIREKAVTLIPTTEVSFGIAPPPKPVEPKKEIPKEPAKSTPSSQIKSLIPVIVDDNLKSDTVQEIKPTVRIGIENISLPASDGPGTIGEPVAGVIGIGVTKPSAPAIDATEPISNPEHEPEFPGGVKALRKFLERNLTNPTEMTEGEMVAVHVKFVVGYDGKLQKFTILQDGGAIFNNEVIRVLKKMPQWIPGKSNGKNVAVYFTIPIKFVSAD